MDPDKTKSLGQLFAWVLVLIICTFVVGAVAILAYALLSALWDGVVA